MADAQSVPGSGVFDTERFDACPDCNEQPAFLDAPHLTDGVPLVGVQRLAGIDLDQVHIVVFSGSFTSATHTSDSVRSGIGLFQPPPDAYPYADRQSYVRPSMSASLSGETTASTHEKRKPTDETPLSVTRPEEGILGLLSGGFATLVMTVFRIPISRSPPPTSWLWAEYIGEDDPEDYPVPGLVLHLVYGVFGGGVFGALVGPLIRGTDFDRELLGVGYGIVYGVVLSVFGQYVLLDRLLGMDLSHDETFVFYVSHLVYGLSLGTWFGSND